MVIVSGMAKGIDAIAHRCAMRNNKKTIAVLGSGLNNIYPEENSDIYNYCKEGKGLIISEYPLDAKPMAEHFQQRNRLISGCADCVFIGHGEKRSGTAITLKYAIAQGKDVLCIPSHLDEGQLTNEAIRDGAFLVTKVDDLKDFLKIK